MSHQNIPIDILIVNYNSTDYLLACVASIYRAAKNRRPVHIYVADNGSTDGVDRVGAIYPEIDLQRNDKNLGFARAVNQCLEKGRSPYLLIVNPDAVVGEGFFDAAMPVMEENPHIGVLGPKILDPDGAVQGSARSFPSPLTALFGRNALLTRLFPGNRFSRRNLLHSASDGCGTMCVDWLSGACLLVRRRAVDAVGGLDPRFFLYWEDADWCIRMKRAGWEVVYYPVPWVIHRVGGSSERHLLKSVLAFHQSAYYLFNKYYPSPAGVLKPVVMAVLAVRFVFVLVSHFLRLRLGRHIRINHHVRP